MSAEISNYSGRRKFIFRSAHFNKSVIIIYPLRQYKYFLDKIKSKSFPDSGSPSSIFNNYKNILPFDFQQHNILICVDVTSDRALPLSSLHYVKTPHPPNRFLSTNYLLLYYHMVTLMDIGSYSGNVDPRVCIIYIYKYILYNIVCYMICDISYCRSRGCSHFGSSLPASRLSIHWIAYLWPST